MHLHPPVPSGETTSCRVTRAFVHLRTRQDRQATTLKRSMSITPVSRAVVRPRRAQCNTPGARHQQRLTGCVEVYTKRTGTRSARHAGGTQGVHVLHIQTGGAGQTCCAICSYPETVRQRLDSQIQQKQPKITRKWSGVRARVAHSLLSAAAHNL
jgi:hypothetical protein